MHTIRLALFLLGAALASVACKDPASAGTDAPTVRPAEGPPSSNDPPQTQQPDDKPGDTFVECTPETRTGGLCTREYRPVCGVKADGTTATYPNKCNACSDTAVLRYSDGGCEAGGS